MQTNKLYYGWFIAAASAFGIGCGIAVIIPAALGLLVAPLHADFGWSSRQIFLAALVNTGCLVIVAPSVGGIVDRFGARRVICLSFVAEALIIPEEMRGQIPGDFGRQRGVACGQQRIRGASGLA